MAWITVSEASVRSRLAEREMTALRTLQVADGQDDPLHVTIARVVDEVRGYIAAHAANRLGPAGTIPAQLEDATLALVRYRLITRLPVVGLLTEERKEEHRDAVSLLRDVALGRFAVERPADAGPESIPDSGNPVTISGDRYPRALP